MAVQDVRSQRVALSKIATPELLAFIRKQQAPEKISRVRVAAAFVVNLVTRQIFSAFDDDVDVSDVLQRSGLRLDTSFFSRAFTFIHSGTWRAKQKQKPKAKATSKGGGDRVARSGGDGVTAVAQEEDGDARAAVAAPALAPANASALAAAAASALARHATLGRCLQQCACEVMRRLYPASKRSEWEQWMCFDGIGTDSWKEASTKLADNTTTYLTTHFGASLSKF